MASTGKEKKTACPTTASSTSPAPLMVAQRSVCKEIGIEYNIKGETNQIQMIINSPGGSCPAGFHHRHYGVVSHPILHHRHRHDRLHGAAYLHDR